MCVLAVGTQFERTDAPYCSNPVSGRRASMSSFDAMPKKRVTAACESMPSPGRNRPALRPPMLAVRPTALPM